MNINKEIGNRLQEVIEDSTYSKASIARELKVGRSTITDLTKFGKVRNSSVFNKICELIGANRNYIINGEGEKFIESNKLNEPPGHYYEEYIKLKGQVELLERHLKERDEHIRELLEICDKKNIKRGARSG